MEQGSIMLFRVSDCHQYTVQTACMWKFSLFILVLVSCSVCLCCAIIVDMGWISLIHNTLFGAEFPLPICCNLDFTMEVDKTFACNQIFRTSCAYLFQFL